MTSGMRGRAVVIFPLLPEPDPVASLRRRFDPLVDVVAAHLTLVLPFESDLSLADLRDHVAHAVRGSEPFPIRLEGVTGVQDSYLFLNVTLGNARLVELYERLYSGPLQPYRSLEFSFLPHVTVGRLPSAEAMQAALLVAASLHIAIDTRASALSICDAAMNGVVSEVPLQ